MTSAVRPMMAPRFAPPGATLTGGLSGRCRAAVRWVRGPQAWRTGARPWWHDRTRGGGWPGGLAGGAEQQDPGRHRDQGGERSGVDQGGRVQSEPCGRHAGDQRRNAEREVAHGEAWGAGRDPDSSAASPHRPTTARRRYQQSVHRRSGLRNPADQGSARGGSRGRSSRRSARVVPDSYRIGYDGSLTRQRVSATLARASTSAAISSSTRPPGLAPAGRPGVPARVVTGSRPAARGGTGRDIGTDGLTPSSS